MSLAMRFLITVLLGLSTLGSVAWAGVTVSLTVPSNGATPTAPVTISATTTATQGYVVSKVEFFQGTTLIGTDTTSPYSIGWNAQPGAYTLTAKATAVKGSSTQTATSSAVSITVNAAPVVTLTSPAEGAVFASPANINVSATASDSDGTITSVRFTYFDFWGGCDAGEITVTAPPYNAVLHPDISSCGADDGNGGHTYYVYATATDNRSISVSTAQATITVTNGNTPPTVSLTTPAPNATFSAPASITLQAQAADSDGTVSSVAFYQGTTLITTLSAPPYSFTWTGVPQGTYSLTARAIDNLGAPVTSTPVNITVNASVAKLHFVHVDHLNTPRAIYDDQQQLRWKWEQQEPFGVNVPDENPSALGAFDFSLRFPGQYADKETNLDYNYFRDYDPAIGRYTQSDPIGLQGGLNVYAYVAGVPLNLVDPRGLDNPGMGPYGPTWSSPSSGPQYNAPPPTTVPVPPAVEAKVLCLEKCLGVQLVITGGAEKSGHQCSASRHYSGEAVDFSFRRNPSVQGRGQDFFCCALECGFSYGLTEGKPPHYHLQTVPGCGVPQIPSNGCSCKNR